jgi:hypothetical protein
MPGSTDHPAVSQTGQIGVIFSDHRGPGWNRQFLDPVPEIRWDEGARNRFGSLITAFPGGGAGSVIAVGTPGFDLGTIEDAGAADLYRGGVALSTDLLDLGVELYGLGHQRRFHQDVSGQPDAAERGDRFGAAVTLADVDSNGAPDLVSGVPGENGSGTVHVIRTPYAKTPASVALSQDAANVPDRSEPGDAFGASLGR